jgi:hypothetical protein
MSANLGDMKHITFKSGTGLVTLHLIDTVDVEPGASLARHTYPSAAPPAATAALTSRRPLRASRAPAAGNFARSADVHTSAGGLQ